MNNSWAAVSHPENPVINSLYACKSVILYAKDVWAEGNFEWICQLITLGIKEVRSGVRKKTVISHGSKTAWKFSLVGKLKLGN